MIRNSDVLFGRTAATYQFIDRETIRQAIREVSALQVFGIDKRIPQLMYEQGYLTQNQIYAILESLLQSHQIQNIPAIQTYLFSDDDERVFCEYCALPYQPRAGYQEILELPAQTLGKNLPISHENLLLCLNIQQSLAKAGIHIRLLNIIFEKKFLNADFAAILPNLAKVRHIIVTPQGRDEKRIRHSIALLFSQIAIVNHKMSPDQSQNSWKIWENTIAAGMQLKYSELLFFLRYLDATRLTRVASFLGSISGIDQHPRFPLLCLSREERQFFEQLLATGAFRPEILAKANQLLERLHQEGLQAISLSEILILQGYLTRQMIVQKWAEQRQKEIVQSVQQLQNDQTRESHVAVQEMNERLAAELRESQAVAKKTEAEIQKYYQDAQQMGHEILSTTSKEDHQFEKELDDTFRTSQERQKKAMAQDVELFKSKVGKLDKNKVRHLTRMIQAYQGNTSQLQWYATTLLIIFSMMILGFLLAWKDRLGMFIEENNDISDQPAHIVTTQPPDRHPRPSDQPTPLTGPEHTVPSVATTTRPELPITPIEQHDPDQKPPQPQPIPKLPEEENAWVWLDKWETARAVKVGQSYAQKIREQGGHIEQGHWLRADWIHLLQDSQEQRKKGYLLFQDRWYNPQELGQWHELVLKKNRERVAGFVLLGQDLCVLRTEGGTRYLQPKQILAQSKTLSPAEYYFEAQEQLATNDAFGHYLFGKWCQTIGMPRYAELEFGKAIAITPNFAEARQASGYIWYQGEWWLAKELAAAEDVARWQDLWIAVGDAPRLGLTLVDGRYIATDEISLAKWLQENGQKGPVALDAQWVQGLTLLLHRQYEGALQCLAKVMEAYPKFPLAKVYEGEIHLQLGNFAGADDDFSRAIQLDMTLFSAYLGRGTVYQRQKKYALARSDFEQALALAPQNIQPYYALVRLFLEIGRKEDILGLIARAEKKVATPPGAAWLKKDAQTVLSLQEGKSFAFHETSPHYAVYGDDYKLFGKVAIQILETFYHYYSSKFKSPALHEQRKILVLPTTEKLWQYTRLEYPLWTHRPCGKWWPVTGEVVIALDQGQAHWQRTLLEAASRQLLDGEERPVPSWLAVGIPAYFAAGTVIAQSLSWPKPTRVVLYEIQKYLQEEPDCLQLLSQPETTFFLPQTRDKKRSLSFAWVYFFVHARNGKYLPLLHEYLALVRQGKSATEATQQLFGPELAAELEQNYRDYWLKE